ncbi:MAG: hypothetical protein PHP44_08885 [Kiritimatiellae bacterium]|nr:hypothetical protein [Kiritimatiellia bacterium]MDD4736207.1 hypothetical protein [Kiritimatiellia bacterium]
MKTVCLAVLLLTVLLGHRPVEAGPVVDDLLTRYDAIHTLSCSVRREAEHAGNTTRMLSRVFYQRPDLLHVQNFSPVKRRYVADGERMYYHVDGDEKGFSRPIAELNNDWLISLRAIPGTPMDHLFRLKGGRETPADPTPEFPIRTACNTESAYAILSQDTSGRLARIELFTTPDHAILKARFDYSQFLEVTNGVSIPCLHLATMHFGEIETKETSRFDNMTVNTPLSPQLFVAAPYFKDVLFVDDFKLIYPD